MAAATPSLAAGRRVSAPAWLRMVRTSRAVAALRSDRARTVLEVAAVLALAARADCTSAPTWRALVQRSGYSRATVARVLAWLRMAQLLVTVRGGSGSRFSSAPVAVQDGGVAVYLLTRPLRRPRLSFDGVDRVDQVDPVDRVED